MKTLTTAGFLLLACLFSTGYAQTLTGLVEDAHTGESIPGATVYLSGTFIGSSTDVHGRFALNVSRYPNMPLIVSAMGYFSAEISKHSEGRTLLVKLIPKVYEIEGVTVYAESLEHLRRQNLAIFRKEFLGTTPNARRSAILNEDDIHLAMNESGQILHAFANHPIQIRNSNLGYHITYFLDQFEFNVETGHLLMIGNFIFSSDTLSDPRQLARMERRRERAYLGSRMHFIRALWRTELKAEKFVLKSPTGDALAYEDLVLIDERWGNDKYLAHTDTISIIYRTSSRQSLLIIPPDYGDVYFGADGYFDPYGIIWDGEMGRSRVGDLLPYEYMAPD
ncbi:MAG: carboxypeptidase-like regulatory domain-containing protein [Bacteroidales bacterium]